MTVYDTMKSWSGEITEIKKELENRGREDVSYQDIRKILYLHNISTQKVKENIKNIEENIAHEYSYDEYDYEYI